MISLLRNICYNIIFDKFKGETIMNKKLFDVNVSIDINVMVWAKDNKDAERVAEDNTSDILKEIDQDISYYPKEIKKKSEIDKYWLKSFPYTTSDDENNNITCEGCWDLIEKKGKNTIKEAREIVGEQGQVQLVTEFSSDEEKTDYEKLVEIANQ
jgi:hypothetical protein